MGNRRAALGAAYFLMASKKSATTFFPSPSSSLAPAKNYPPLKGEMLFPDETAGRRRITSFTHRQLRIICLNLR
jgi:hypothetical protein